MRYATTNLPKNFYRITTVLAFGALIASPFVAHGASARAASIQATTQLSESTGFHAEQLAAYPAIAKSFAERGAADTIAEANRVIAAVHTKIDASALSSSVTTLGGYKKLDVDTIHALTGEAQAATAAAAAAAAEVDRIAAERAAAAAAAAAEALRVANTPDGARATARSMAASAYGWGDAQFSCLDQLWSKESGWRFQAQNNSFSPSSAPVPSAQAYGIPQSGPGAKMALMGADWETNASTQIAWGLSYIKTGYGSPCGAWSHSVSSNWY